MNNNKSTGLILVHCEVTSRCPVTSNQVRSESLHCVEQALQGVAVYSTPCTTKITKVEPSDFNPTWNFNLKRAPQGQMVLVSLIQERFGNRPYTYCGFCNDVDTGSWLDENGAEFAPGDRVIAWMPKPKPAELPKETP